MASRLNNDERKKRRESEDLFARLNESLAKAVLEDFPKASAQSEWFVFQDLVRIMKLSRSSTLLGSRRHGKTFFSFLVLELGNLVQSSNNRQINCGTFSQGMLLTYLLILLLNFLCWLADSLRL
jgi:hypothetical protein